jgi:hypothetical protein
MAEIKAEHRSEGRSRDDRYADDERYTDDRGRRRRSARRDVRALTGSSLDVTREAARLARAYTEANAEIWIGATRVVGGLVGDLTDALIGNYSDNYDDDDYDDYDDYDDDRAGGRSTEVEYRAGRGGTRASASYESDRRGPRRGVRGVRGPTRDIARSVSDAIRESARVAQRSADRFTRVYEDRNPRSEEESLAQEEYGPEPGEGRGRSRRQEGGQGSHILNDKGQPIEASKSSIEIKTEKKS